jgi:hypothetical protein
MSIQHVMVLIAAVWYAVGSWLQLFTQQHHQKHMSVLEEGNYPARCRSNVNLGTDIVNVPRLDPDPATYALSDQRLGRQANHQLAC